MPVLSNPAWYPDAVTPEGVAAELTRVAAELGLEIGCAEPVVSEGAIGARIVSPIPGHADASVKILRTWRRFRFDNNESDVRRAYGHTSVLGEVAYAVAAWSVGADPRGIKAAAQFVHLPEMAEARATGSAELVVKANWRTRRRSWQLQRDLRAEEGVEAPVVLESLLALFVAVGDTPKLRSLFGVTSHYNLWFSRCTDVPFAKVGAIVLPLPDGRFEILARHSGGFASSEAEYAGTAQDAIARAAELVPEDCGPAIIGTAAAIPNPG